MSTKKKYVRQAGHEVLSQTNWPDYLWDRVYVCDYGHTFLIDRERRTCPVCVKMEKVVLTPGTRPSSGSKSKKKG